MALFRLERAVGFREPEECNPATRAFLVVAFLAALVLVVFPAMDAQMLALVLVRLAPLGVLIGLIVQMAGDFFYRANRRLSAALRVAVRLVIAPAASLVAFVVLAYSAHGGWFALLVAGLFCVVFSGALFLNRVSGLRRPRGIGPV